MIHQMNIIYLRRNQIMKIGYIGLGLMGGPLARNLIRAGKEVKVLGLNIINDLIKIDNNGAVIFVNLNEIEFNQKPN